ncbi:hypothetical protein RS130_13475 [Paraglaciecola aquimarina]|uniref:Lipoprotein n=1 Tax=Paraglaciecola aquimarina TaxID=1235557 RepID=A0ABU3SXQ0_9ALTE|nr:hypothetical protein [Paraglaciecola aquimarina]MDU0354795.1 hypothetical protein [Paraglaciecola aquimarina]
MKIRVFLSLLLPILSGCELLPKAETEKVNEGPVVPITQKLCLWAIEFQNDCQVEYWLKFWANIETLSWKQRKQKIDALSDSDVDVLKKIILSQGKGTPYQDRLRAQMWSKSITPKLSKDMRQFLQTALFQPSLEILQLESALVTVNKINSENENIIKQQKEQINKQNNQIDQLLNIETSIMSNGQRNGE